MKNIISHLKNNNILLLLLWHIYMFYRGKLDLKIKSDKTAIEKLYFNYSGKYLNLETPITFSEKIQWLKLNYHNPQLEIFADKFFVRNFLINKGYSEILSNVIGYYTTIDDIKIEDLPKRFVMKASHGSGWNLIVKDKKIINWNIWLLIFKYWLKDNIFWQGREWCYKNMPQGIICEEYMEDDKGELNDYKFFCFNGKVKFVQANKGRGTNIHAQNFYDLNWKLLPFGKDLTPLPDVIIDKPYCLNEMIDISRDLSHKLPFVRVDLYEVKKKIIFGEMTFYPKSGLPDFIPNEYDEILGRMLELP